MSTHLCFCRLAERQKVNKCVVERNRLKAAFVADSITLNAGHCPAELICKQTQRKRHVLLVQYISSAYVCVYILYISAPRSTLDVYLEKGLTQLSRKYIPALNCIWTAEFFWPYLKQTFTFGCIYARTHAHAHTQTHRHTEEHTHTHTHRHIYTHTQTHRRTKAHVQRH